MGVFGLAIGVEMFLIAELVTESALASALLSSCTVALFSMLWFAAPWRAARRDKPRLSRAR